MSKELKFEQSKDDEKKISELANKLERMQVGKNEGRGVQHIQYIIDDLRKGDIEKAKADCFNQSDKFSGLEDVKTVLIEELFGASEKHPWSLIEKLKTKRD